LTIQVATVLAVATCLISCSQPSDDTFSGTKASPIGEKSFDEIEPGDCLADVSLSGGKLQTADCSSDEALTVVGITVAGEAAPPDEPSPAMRNALGSDACDPVVSEWADKNSRDLKGLMQAITIDDEWAGSQTAVVCSIAASE
jgi:hypothetical protein